VIQCCLKQTDRTDGMAGIERPQKLKLQRKVGKNKKEENQVKTKPNNIVRFPS